MKKIEIGKNDNNQKLIKYLGKFFETAPKSLIQKWMRLKKIKVNGKKVDTQTVIYEGDILDLYIYDEEIDKWKKKKKSKISKIKIDIAFENDDIIVFDKPQNMLVHAANPEDYGNNVVDYMVNYLIEKQEYIPRIESTFRPSLVNRIDRNTMGLIIGAKNRNALINLNNSMKMIRKYYLAVVHGVVDKEIVVENTLSKDEKNYVSVSDSGKLSKTIIRPISFSKNYSLIEIELLTGRTHQIRVTLSDIGHPIVGDRRYGKNILPNVKDQQLVAYKLIFSDDIPIKSIKNLVIKSKYDNMLYELFNNLKEL
ncbi:MAG: RluA family pseudouridine synthase [Tissierellia bacterium]|nr:RluA family pseudouridine synthase [Tissierellia bacterium]